MVKESAYIALWNCSMLTEFSSFRSYYFTLEQVDQLFRDAGFVVSSNYYVSRRTVNKKEGLNAERIFVQGKFMKPEE